jgi:predicted amidohydrolase
MKDIKIALIIFKSEKDKKKNLEKMALIAKNAKNKGADIVCFPELNITGYSLDERIKKEAESIPGFSSDVVLKIAQKEKIVILAGMPETISEKISKKDEKIFISQICADPDKKEIGVYRKIHISPFEKKIFSHGDKIEVFETKNVKFGIQLCYDAHFPELSSAMTHKGAELIFIPHASPMKTPEEKLSSWMRHMPARAYDNSVFIAACNLTGEYKKDMIFPGVVLALNPEGKIIAKKTEYNKEDMLLCTLKASDINEIKKSKIKYFFPNRREEIYYEKT